ncbi:MAG: RNA polymerase sigma-70 factor [Bacteroidales bacterium]
MELSYEKILLQRIKDDDEHAFAIIFSKYYSDLIFFANHYVHSIDSAEEIIQDIFVQLWDNRKILDVHTSLKSYLLKITQNKCFDYLRHKQVKDRYTQLVLQKSTLFENDTENYILFSELNEKLNEALAQLDPEIAQVFRLHRFEGFSYDEISKKLNISTRTVEYFLSKALSNLRKILKDYFPFLIILL